MKKSEYVIFGTCQCLQLRGCEDVNINFNGHVVKCSEMFTLYTRGRVSKVLGMF